MADKKKRNELSDAAAKLGAAGGKKGGPARDAALSHDEKVRIARMGGMAKKAKGESAKRKIRKKK
jgi:hypothetical protein